MALALQLQIDIKRDQTATRDSSGAKDQSLETGNNGAAES